MEKIVIFLKYTGAVIVFFVSYLICSIIAHFAVRIVNYGVGGFWIDFLPFLAAVAAGSLSVQGGLVTVKRLFATVRLRTVAWVLISFMGIIWIGPVIGLFISLVGIVDYSLEGHILMSAETLPQALQSLVAAIAAWVLTADEDSQTGIED